MGISRQQSALLNASAFWRRMPIGPHQPSESQLGKASEDLLKMFPLAIIACMFNGRSGCSPLLVFLGVAFGGSILLSLVIGLSGGYKSSLVWLAPLSMLVPALGVLVAYVTLGAHLGIEWNRLPRRWLPVALLILPLAIHAVALPGVVVLEGRAAVGPMAHTSPGRSLPHATETGLGHADIVRTRGPHRD